MPGALEVAEEDVGGADAFTYHTLDEHVEVGGLFGRDALQAFYGEPHHLAREAEHVNARVLRGKSFARDAFAQGDGVGRLQLGREAERLVERLAVVE
jgi:hypothetical protein